jgi:hypothetical protein
MKEKLLLLIALFVSTLVKAQDINCNIIINSSAIPNVDQKIFKTLQQGLLTFVNTRKWAVEEIKTEEAIDVNFNITLLKKGDAPDSYEAKLTIQSSRPVYGTDYNSTIVNYIDNAFKFKYVQFQAIDFNENRIVGNDPLVSNLSATIAYYIYLSLGLNYDSYKLKAGQEYFNKALNIVNNAPEGYGITGWKNNEAKNKNRYWFVDNILNSRFSSFREVIYNYHRNGLDQMISNKEEAQKVILKTISTLTLLNGENPGSAILYFYFNAKNEELLNILSSAPAEERATLLPQMAILDVTNANKYNALIKN